MMARHPNSQRFHDLLAVMGETHDRKQEDYGSEGDPFHNVRASEEFGMPGYLGCWIRMNDKMTRLKTYAKKGTLANEGVLDTLMDLAVYSIIAYCLFEQEQNRLALPDETPEGEDELPKGEVVNYATIIQVPTPDDPNATVVGETRFDVGEQDSKAVARELLEQAQPMFDAEVRRECVVPGCVIDH